MIPTLNGVTAGGQLSLAEFISLASRHGFSAVEFSIEQVAQLAAETSFAGVAALFEEPKILPAVFDLPVGWRGSEETYQAGLARLPSLAKLAQDLDSSRCCTWVAPDNGEPAGEYAARSTRRLLEIAKILSDQGIRLGSNSLGPAHFRPDPNNVWFHDIPGALEAVAAISTTGQLENVGLLVDSFHWYTSGGTAMDLASIPVQQIVHVHISDATDLPRDAQTDMQRLLPGESNVIDLPGFLGTLAAIGYDGPVSVETFNEDLRALPPDEFSARAASSLAHALRSAGIAPVRLI